MEPILGVFKIIKKDVWMASVDLMDVFFTIPIDVAYQKHFIFEWLGNYCSDAIRVFTKVSKPVYGYLRQQDYLSLIFMDDSYLQRGTEQECLQNIEPTLSFLESLDFDIHKGKSILNSTEEINFLGFVFNSVAMAISITNRKTEVIVSKFRKSLESKSSTIRELASVIGSIVSLFPAIPFGKLHYRVFKKDKNSVLKKGCWKF